METGGNAKAIEKRCRVCDADVAGKKRTKDEAGNYYCQPCYLNAVSKPRSATSHNEVIPIAEPPPPITTRASAIADAQELYTCPECGGMFSQSAMDESGVCVGCVNAKQPKDESPSQQSRFKWKRLAIGAAIATVSVVGIVFVISVFFFRSTKKDVEAADKKIQAGYERLIEKAKDDATAVRRERPEPTAPPRLTRSELVDNDSTLSSIASRGPELDNALRGVEGATLANSTLRLAWTSQVITYEEYQYAQQFRHQQGDFP